MKKSNLILLTLVPCFAGYLINNLVGVDVIGMWIYHSLPLIVVAFWFWLGFQYSKTDWTAIQSILIGNTVGMASLILYLWQFLGQSDERRSMFLAGLSQAFTSATPTYLISRLAILFETQPDYIGERSVIAMHVIALMLMMVIFAAGYFAGRGFKQKQNHEETTQAFRNN